MVAPARARPPFLVRAAWAAQRSLQSLYSSVASVTGFFGAAYPSTDPSRKEVFQSFRPRYITPNQLLGGSLSALSAQCRQLERQAPEARGAVEGLVSELVGSGIDVLPDCGSETLDPKLYQAWLDWAEHACVDGSSLWQWQATAVRELGTSGNALARLVVLPERIKKGWLPLALLPLEVEWASELPVASVPREHTFVRGLELDRLGRVQAYHLRNPEVTSGDAGERVEASKIVHIFERRRPQQVWGEPILAPVIERILQDSRLIETELKAAIATAAPAVAIISTAGGFADGNETDDDGEPVTDIPAGATVRLADGENVATIENNRPSQLIAPFRQTIQGDIAAATRVSRYYLTRDFSSATFMNMRIEQQIGKRGLATLKEVLGVGAASKPYEAVFPWLMLALGVQLPADAAALAQRMRHHVRPDQPEYVDPTKDVQASVNAIANNLSTYDIELASRGKNFRQVFQQRKVENALLAEMGLPLPVPVKSPNAQPGQEGGAGEADDDDEEELDDEASDDPAKKEAAA